VSAWRDRLYRALARPPFRDEAGRKGWLEPFTRAPRHHVRTLKLGMPGWPHWPRPLRVAFLSDFHTGGHAGDIARFAAMIAEAASHAPDLALYGGDFVNMMPFGGGRIPPHVTAAILARLPAPLGRFATLGNHDRNYGPDEVAEALRANDIAVLLDTAQEADFHGVRIPIVGIQDARRDRPAARTLLASLSPERPTIVLAHDPYWFAHLPSGPHLMLAGHTHGGQVCLPGIGPLINASRAPLRWSYGLIEETGRRMYVTSGLGCSSLPLRFRMPPEWVLLELNGLSQRAAEES
jgi:predicted MPP superfamily phosphohydrolase